MKIKNVANTKSSQILTQLDKADVTADEVTIAHTQ